MAAALVAAGGWLAYDRVWLGGGEQPVAWRAATVPVPTALVRRPAVRVFESRRARYVVVALGPRSSDGWSIHVRSVREQRGRIVVSVRERAPVLGDRVEPRVTYPFRVLALPRGEKPIRVEREVAS